MKALMINKVSLESVASKCLDTENSLSLCRSAVRLRLKFQKDQDSLIEQSNTLIERP